MTNGILEREQAKTASKALGSSQGPWFLYFWWVDGGERGVMQTQVKPHLTNLALKDRIREVRWYQLS